MMTKGPVLIEDANLSLAWARAFSALMSPGVSEIETLVVTVTEFHNGTPVETDAIRELLDVHLVADGKRTCHSVANTLFPSHLWRKSKSRDEFYKRYQHMLPRIHSSNPYGVYFERLTAFGTGGAPVNQLEHIISTRAQHGNHRRSAMQACIFDPRRDHTHQRQRGFPCLQQVVFAPHGAKGLSVTGFYAMQYIFTRAYGNYLGLCRIGQFVAENLGLNLERMTCIAGIEKRDPDLSLSKARPLHEALVRLLGRTAPLSLVGAD